MSLDIVRQFTPEEEELAAKREELAQLEAELADRELGLASLKAELAAFEGLYLRRVGFFTLNLTNGRRDLPNSARNRLAPPRRDPKRVRRVLKLRNLIRQPTVRRQEFSPLSLPLN